jgi:DNA polymerase/3'-5' exonuclease PolX
MDLPLAQKYARHILAWLTPFCDGPTGSIRIEIAGSIRRQRPQCADVDIVCIPKYKIDHDLFQAEQARANLLWQHLTDYVRTYQPDYGTAFDTSEPASNPPPPKILQGENYSPGMKQMIVQLPRVQLDLWFADESNFASRLLMRTGSKEHNIWLAERAQRHGLAWKPYEGLYKRGPGLGGMAPFSELLPAATEAELYAHLDLPYIDPINREIDWLTSAKL